MSCQLHVNFESFLDGRTDRRCPTTLRREDLQHTLNMPTTRSKSKGKKSGGKDSWVDRLSVKEDSSPVRTAKYFGEQAVEGHHLLTERRQREANPHLNDPYFMKVQEAARRMADKAAVDPIPTSRPSTVNGVTKSETILKQHRDYKAWRAQLEKEAILEVQAELKKAGQLKSKSLQRRFKLETPSPTGGVEGDWRPALW